MTPADGPATQAPPSAHRTARERVRQELVAEITDVARAQLAAHGGAALSVRAVARELGMASSALFRYFPTRDALLTALIIDSYGALADAAEGADAAATDRSVLGRWEAICHGVRDWAMSHPHEYALIFGSPIPGYAAPQDTIAPATRVPTLLVGLLLELTDGGAPAAPLDDDARSALEPLLSTLPPHLPADLIARGIMAWTYLFGAVSFELFGHRHNVVDDSGRFFAHEVRRIAVLLGLGDEAGAPSPRPQTG